MATDDIFLLSLENLPRDVLSLVLLELSAKEIHKLGLTSKKMSNNVKSALQTAQASAYNLFVNSPPSALVNKFIQALDHALAFVHQMRALYNGSAPDKDEFIAMARSEYGYQVHYVYVNDSSEIRGALVLCEESSLTLTFHWCEHCFGCIIESVDKAGSRHRAFYEKKLVTYHYQLSESMSLHFNHLLVMAGAPIPKRATHGAWIEVSKDASLKELAQAAIDSDALYGVFEVWGEADALKIKINPQIFDMFFNPSVSPQAVLTYPKDIIPASLDLWRLVDDFKRVPKFVKMAIARGFSECSARTWAGVQFKLGVSAAASGYQVLDVVSDSSNKDNVSTIIIKCTSGLSINFDIGRKPYKVHSVAAVYRHNTACQNGLFRIHDFNMRFKAKNSVNINKCRWKTTGTIQRSNMKASASITDSAVVKAFNDLERLKCFPFCRNMTLSYELYDSSEIPPESTVLERWLQNWTATPPAAPLFDGAEPPSALSWARRRGPQDQHLPDAVLHKLFRNEAIRVYDPSANQVKRVKKDTLLPLGARLLFPQEIFNSNNKVEKNTTPTPHNSPASISAAKIIRNAVLFENDELIAINKPSGITVQGGTGINPRLSIDSLLPLAFPEHFPTEKNEYSSTYNRIKLVHRLDKDVTGVLILGKGSHSTARLAEAFRGKSLKAAGAAVATRNSSIRQPGVEKVYWAVVVDPNVGSLGVREGNEGYVDTPITDSSNSNTITSAALTRYKVLQVNKKFNAAWLELEPLTGRKHQLRQHCARELGMPILGDRKYGLVRKEPQKSLLEALKSGSPTPKKQKEHRDNAVTLFLHCRSIKFDIPGQKKKGVRMEAPVPESWELLFDQLKWQF